MSTPVGERVGDWNERSFSDGYRGLNELADSDFSGVVRAGGAELYMTKGVVVGIERGSIEDIEGASGTLYEAPTDALPLLAVMQTRSDDVRGRYYSEDTGLSEVDETLSDGNFTGYLELSENVLSGDYYLVYHRGRSMSVAFVGNSDQLLVGDEAFERADGEVGIYEVYPVGIDAIEIPDPPEPEPTDSVPAGVDAASASGNDPPASGSTGPTAEMDTDGDRATGVDPDSPEDDETKRAGSEPIAETDRTEPAAGDIEELEAGTERSESESPEETDPPAPTRDTEPEVTAPSDGTRGDVDQEPTSVERDRVTEPSAGTSEDDADTHAGSIDEEPTAPSVETTPDGPGEAEDASEQPGGDQTADTGAADGTEPAQEAETGIGPATTEDPSSLETRAIPSLDPERTSSHSQSSEPRRDVPGRTDADGPEDVGQEQQHAAVSESPAGQATARAQSTTEHAPETNAEPSPTPTPESEESDAASEERAEESDAASEERADEEGDTGETTPSEVTDLRELLTDRETEIERLKATLQQAKSERDSLREKLTQVKSERDELESQIETLEGELRQLEEELGAATDAQQRITPQEALSGTDVFVRYRSKGDDTLEKAYDGSVRKDGVTENLRLEKHTQFDADISAVNGQEYDQFLGATVDYKFVRWVVEDLLFEIQSTGHTESLSDLYEALPKINRVELNGAVTVTETDGGEEREATETFDIVFRERMGDPLLVADINDSRQGASQSMMEGLITAAERVGQTSDDFAAAFLVTESFFEPEALEAVEAATRGGLLSRDKRKSFVNLSRKRGYHLCLVEARNKNFHLEVPEL